MSRRVFRLRDDFVGDYLLFIRVPGEPTVMQWIRPGERVSAPLSAEFSPAPAVEVPGSVEPNGTFYDRGGARPEFLSNGPPIFTRTVPEGWTRTVQFGVFRDGVLHGAYLRTDGATGSLVFHQLATGAQTVRWRVKLSKDDEPDVVGQWGPVIPVTVAYTIGALSSHSSTLGYSGQNFTLLQTFNTSGVGVGKSAWSASFDLKLEGEIVQGDVGPYSWTSTALLTTGVAFEAAPNSGEGGGVPQFDAGMGVVVYCSTTRPLIDWNGTLTSDTASNEFSVGVTPLFPASFSVGAASATTVTAIDTSVTGGSYHHFDIDFGEESSEGSVVPGLSPGATVEYTYNVTGVHTITLTRKTSGGAVIDRTSRYFTVEDGGGGEGGASFDYESHTLTVNVYDTSTGSEGEYNHFRVNWGDGGESAESENIGPGGNVANTYATAGTYTVTLTRYTDSDTVIDTTSRDITVESGGGEEVIDHGSPSFSFETGPFYLSLVDTSTGTFNHFEMDWGDGQTTAGSFQPGTSLDHNYEGEGVYTVRLTRYVAAEGEALDYYEVGIEITSGGGGGGE